VRREITEGPPVFYDLDVLWRAGLSSLVALPGLAAPQDAAGSELDGLGYGPRGTRARCRGGVDRPGCVPGRS